MRQHWRCLLHWYSYLLLFLAKKCKVGFDEKARAGFSFILRRVPFLYITQLLPHDDHSQLRDESGAPGIAGS